MAPNSWMVHISSEKPGNGRSGKELNFLATVVSSGETGLAFIADDVRFDGYTVSDLETFHRRVNSQDDSRRFMSEDVRVCDNHRTDTASMPKVNVRSEGIVSRASHRVFSSPTRRFQCS